MVAHEGVLQHDSCVSATTLAAHIHAASWRLIELLAEFEAVDGWQGWPSPAHWLKWRCGFSINAAREKFRVARALLALPLIREAFRKGELSFAQVRAMTRVATPDNETTVLMWAQHRERSFSHWEEDHGMVSFRIRLPAEQAAVVLKAIEAAKASLDGRDHEELVWERLQPRPAPTDLSEDEDPPACRG